MLDISFHFRYSIFNLDNLKTNIPSNEPLPIASNVMVPITPNTSVLNNKNSFWRLILSIIILSIVGFIFSNFIWGQSGIRYFLAPLLFYIPFNPFVDVLSVPILVFFYFLLEKFLILERSNKKLLLIVGTSFITVTIFNFLYFTYITVPMGEKYLKSQVDKTIKQQEEIVGTKGVFLTYLKLNPVYSQDGYIQNIEVMLSARFPKAGNYKISGNLTNVGYNLYDSKQPDIYMPSQKLESHYNADSDQEVKLIFDAKELRSLNFSDKFNVTLDIWRTGIEVQQPFGGGTQDWARVEVKDSGKSTNVVTTRERGAEEPQYTIGPFILKMGN